MFKVRRHCDDTNVQAFPRWLSCIWHFSACGCICFFMDLLYRIEESRRLRRVRHPAVAFRHALDINHSEQVAWPMGRIGLHSSECVRPVLRIWRTANSEVDAMTDKRGGQYTLDSRR
jgi:hypothetical protein